VNDGSVRLVEDRVQALIFLYEHHRKLAMGYKQAGEDEAFEIEGQKAHRAFAALEQLAYTKASRMDSWGFYTDDRGRRLTETEAEEEEKF